MSAGAGAGAGAGERLARWLAGLGYPAGRLPAPHALHQLCRGNYAGVWEDLMRKVLPRQTVRRRRLQVFVEDFKLFQSQENTVQERIGAVVVPEQLEVWRETQMLKEEVARAEARVAESKKQVNALAASVASKLQQRDAISESVMASHCRLCLLNATSERLRAEVEQLTEMTRCTDELSPRETKENYEEVIDKCLAILSELAGKQTVDKNLQFNSTHLSNVSERADKDGVLAAHDKLLSLLAHVSGEELWSVLQERQGRLVREMAERASVTAPIKEKENEAQSCVAATSALHCALTLDALLNRHRTPAYQRQLLLLIQHAPVAGTGQEAEARSELFTLHCEKADLESRVCALRSELDDLTHRRGAYKLNEREGQAESAVHILTEIAALDRECLSRKAETEARMFSLERTTHKIANVCSQLGQTFMISTGHSNPAESLTGGKHNFSVNSVNSNYEEFVSYFTEPQAAGLVETDKPEPPSKHNLSLFTNRDKRQHRSLELTLSLDNTLTDDTEGGEMRFADELRLFLNKFQLDKNRKIVLDSGESLWIFETLSSTARYVPSSQSTRSTHTYVLGTASIRVSASEHLGQFVRAMAKECWSSPPDTGFALLQAAGEARIDRLKKRLHDNATSIHRTSALLATGGENLQFWRDGKLSEYIGESRTVEGRSYKECCALYEEWRQDRF